MRAQLSGQTRPLNCILSAVWMCIGPLALTLTGCDSDEECARSGVDCVKSCGDEEVPFCVSTGICACVPAMTGGDVVVGGGTPLGGVDGGGIGGTTSASCAPPPMGVLIINEVLVDAVNEDTGEFFELANLHDEAVSLAGVKIVYRGSDKVRFLTGCMAPKSVAALWGDESAWAWSTAPTGLTYEKLSYRLSNSGDILAELVNESGEVLSELSATADLIEEGVSVNRAVDFTEGPSAQHSALFNTPHSAGLCGEGGALEEGCPTTPTGGTTGPIGGETGGSPGGGTQMITSCDPPPSGALIINEVMVDAVDEATGEFFELANLHSDYVDLSGLKLTYRGSDKVRFLSGCMAPKSIGALWGDEGAWAWSSEPVNLSYEKLSYRLSNSSDVLAQLVDSGGELLSELSASTELIEEGVSINRAVDFTEGPTALHTSLFGSEHSAGLCVAGGRLEDGCPESPTGGSPVGGSLGGGEAGAQAGGHQGGGGGEPAPQCDTAELGELIINEVMIDAAVEPAEEYIELVNTTERPLNLAGLSVAYNSTVKLSFERGCMPGKSAVAFYSDETLTSWSSAPEGLEMSQSAFRFANSNDYSFVLSNSSGEDLDRFEGLGAEIQPEVSLNRSPDLSGAPALHTALSELSSSPGLCPHGGLYEEGCPNAPQGGAPAGGVEGGAPAGGLEGGAPAGGLEGGAPAGGAEPPVGGAPAGGLEGGAPAGGAEPPVGGTPVGGVEGGTLAGGVEAGATGGGVEGGVTPEPCNAPSNGELMLNEVLANPLDNENLTVNKTEWIELLNVTDQWLNLEGLTLSNEDVIKVTFGALCLAPRSALVIYNQRDASSWVSSSPLQGDPLSSQVASFSITNSRALNLTLRDQAGLLSELSTVDAISSYPEGVSLNRDPDQDPNATVSAHDSLSEAGGALSSQGLCANGARFEEGCTTP